MRRAGGAWARGFSAVEHPDKRKRRQMREAKTNLRLPEQQPGLPGTSAKRDLTLVSSSTSRERKEKRAIGAVLQTLLSKPVEWVRSRSPGVVRGEHQAPAFARPRLPILVGFERKLGRPIKSGELRGSASSVVVVKGNYNDRTKAIRSDCCPLDKLLKVFRAPVAWPA